MQKIIKKASGEFQEFDAHKFRRSLEKSGADSSVIDSLIASIEKNTELKTTHEIYKFAYDALLSQKSSLAARYSLKNALIQLGPTGYPFEGFIAQLFVYQGYETQTGIIVQGKCITHEIDLIANNKSTIIVGECKFHNRLGLKSDSKVTLYFKSRFDDVQKSIQEKFSEKKHVQSLLVTNTKFTTEAIAYAQCVGIELLGWSYPMKHNLAELIDQYRLYPITVLTALNNRQKRIIIQNGTVLCRDLLAKPTTLKQFRLSLIAVEIIMKELQEICDYNKA